MLSGELHVRLTTQSADLSMVFVNGDRLVCVPEEFAGARCSDRALCAALVHCSPARCPTVAVQSSWQATWFICARSRLGCCVTRIQRVVFAGCLDWQVFNHVQVRDDSEINESLHNVCVCVRVLWCVVWLYSGAAQQSKTPTSSVWQNGARFTEAVQTTCSFTVSSAAFGNFYKFLQFGYYT